MRIPLVNLTKNSNQEQKLIFNKIKKVLQKGDFILGKEVDEFENKFASYLGLKYCVGVASGSDALFLSLKALEIGEGDEVIVPAMTFIATASTVIHAGAKPVLVDILPDLPTIDTTLIESAITKRTKAIIPVHMHGYPCAMDEIKVIANKYKLFIIEDACQAHGSLYKQKHAGALGDLAAFSFYPSKNLGSYGDAGAITTSDKKLYEKLLKLRNHGQKQKSLHEVLGYNSRLDVLQAAVLNVKIKHLDGYNKKRRKNALLYMQYLKDSPIIMYQTPEGVQTNYYVFGVEVEERDSLIQYLRTKNVSCDVHYSYPLHLHQALLSLGYKKGDFPRAEKFSKVSISLPMYPELSEKEIQYICKSIRSFFVKGI